MQAANKTNAEIPGDTQAGTGANEPLLVTDRLVKEYRSRRVVNGVSIDVGAGEIVGLLASLRAKAPTRGQAWRGLARFADFYLRKLWQAYAHLPQRRATRQKLATRRSESRN